MYYNLRKVMYEKNVTGSDIANVINCDEMLIESRFEETGFSFNEGIKIRNCYFGEYSLEFLFHEKND